MDNNEILANKLQRMASINYMVIEKAVVDDFNYGAKEATKASENSSGVQVTKKGKEVKEALQKEYSILLNNKVSLFKEMGDLVEKIGFLPTTSCKDEYYVNGWEGKIELPKKYAYDQMYTKEGEDYNTSQPVSVSKEMREYNELSRKYIVSSIELKVLQTLINNIDENKSFKLSINLAAKLGF